MGVINVGLNFSLFASGVIGLFQDRAF